MRPYLRLGEKLGRFQSQLIPGAIEFSIFSRSLIVLLVFNVITRCGNRPYTRTGVLSRARQTFPVDPVRTLEALHLASVLAWDQAIARLTVVSCDDRVRANVLALGFDVVPQ